MVSNVMRVSASDKIGDRLIAAAQVAGVLATGWFVWINAVLPRLGLQSLAGIAAQALSFVTLAWICGAVVTFWIYLVVSLTDLPHVMRFSLCSSAPAMWFAPAIVLLSVPLATAFVVSLFLVVNATRHLVAQWGAIQSPMHGMEPAPAEPAFLFRTAPPNAGFLSWSWVPVLMGSLTAQAGLVAMLWRHQFRAAVLLAVSTAILTSLSIATGAYRPGKPPALPHSALSVLWTFLLAAALTFGGISARGRHGGGSDASDSSSPAGQSGAQVATQAAAPRNENMGFGGDFPGVILLPALKPNATLLIPVPAPPREFGAPLVQPVGIPFSGEYWMFRWPATRPPLGAAIRRGNAAELSFHTTDGWPMEMEAHQKLEPPVDIKCCSEIQLAIQNTDQYPGTISLELILIDRTAATNPAQSLGAVAAGSPSLSVQLLRFPIPRVPAIGKFDEFKVVFRRAQLRADRSARIAIERFVLVP
jgi:hypothetical protein